jgi:hypothetical protein
MITHDHDHPRKFTGQRWTATVSDASVPLFQSAIASMKLGATAWAAFTPLLQCDFIVSNVLNDVPLR